MQVYLVMSLIWFYELNESGDFWPWHLTLRAVFVLFSIFQLWRQERQDAGLYVHVGRMV